MNSIQTPEVFVGRKAVLQLPILQSIIEFMSMAAGKSQENDSRPPYPRSSPLPPRSARDDVASVSSE